MPTRGEQAGFAAQEPAGPQKSCGFARAHEAVVRFADGGMAPALPVGLAKESDARGGGEQEATPASQSWTSSLAPGKSCE